MARAKSKPTTKSGEEVSLIEKLAKLERENEALKNDSDNFGIPLDAYIEVMSLFSGKLTLTTEPLGKGKRFQFGEFGETKRILYNDLASVMENYRTFMEKGYFYIMNEKVVRKHGLNDIYASILSKKMMESVLNCDPKLAVKLYESANESQRDIMDGMLVQEIKNGEADLNVIAEIAKIAKKDLIKLAEESKALDEISTQ